MASEEVRTKTANNNIVPLDSHKHAGLGISLDQANRFASRHNVIPLQLTEFFYAGRNYPIVFLKSATGPLQTCAISGLQQGENLFVDAKGDWLEHHYQPAYIRRFPFYVNTIERGKTLILVDETGLEASAQPFFERNGVASEKWQTMETFLGDYVSAEKLTVQFADKLDNVGLLEPFDAQINPDQSDSRRITGMYRVNEDKLNKLQDEVIRDLMQKGELARIYAHLISLENFARLLDLSAAKSRLTTIKNKGN